MISQRQRNQPNGIMIRQRFAEARFGLEQALQMAPDCDGVLPELQQLLSVMRQWLVDNKHLDEAEHLLLSMPKEDEELNALVVARKNEAAQEAAEMDYLKKVAPAFDPNVNAIGRYIFGAIIIGVVAITVMTVVIYDTLFPAEISPTRLVFSTGSVALIICVALIVIRRWLFNTNLGSRLGHTIVLGFCAAPLFAIACMKAGYPGNVVMIGDTLFVALAMAGLRIPLSKAAG